MERTPHDDSSPCRDDDMQSTFSAMSVGTDTSHRDDDTDEEEEEL